MRKVNPRDPRGGLRAQLDHVRALTKRNIDLYVGIYKDERTPKLSKFLLWLALGYLFLPFDLIPDFIPVIGQLDDVIIVPLLIYLAIRMVPDEVYEEHYNRGRS